MIIDALFSVLLAPIKLLLSALPTIGYSLPDGIFNSIVDTFAFIGYVLPIESILMCLSIRLALISFRATMAVVVRVKSFIPTMGS